VESEIVASLKVIKGPNVGSVFELTASESVMGRYPFCDIVLPSHTISRQHARVVQVDDHYFVEDMNSLNGTFVNGDRVRGRVQLKDQDRIRLYETLLIFRLTDESEHEQNPDAASSEIAQTAPFFPVGAGNEDFESEASSDRAIAVVSALELRSGVCGGEQGQEHLRAILRRMQLIDSQNELSVMLAQILDAMFEIFPSVERGHILLVQQPGGRLELKASKHRQEGTMTQMTLGPISQTLAKRVIARGEAVLTGGEEESDSVLAGGSPSSMCAPLLGPSRTPLGILHLDATLGEQPFSENDLNALVSIGMIAGQAIECAQLLGVKSAAAEAKPLSRPAQSAEGPDASIPS
jgi:hypothetical protein